MWWYGYGWWWWWIAFLLLFFLLPLAYGWAYRGWGPWYRRRRIGGGRHTPSGYVADVDRAGEWGALALVLWAVLAIAVLWLILAMTWMPRM